MGLERFKRFTSTDKGFMPTVSIWNKGQFWFTSGAVNKFDLHKYSYVIFLYDEKKREVGLLFTEDEKEDGAVKLGKRDSGIVVGGKNFLDCFEIDYSKTKQYLMRVEEEPSLFVINLEQGKVSERESGETEKESD
jgi:hypothetical protein